MQITIILKGRSLRWHGHEAWRPHKCMTKQLFFATGVSGLVGSPSRSWSAPGCVMP